MGQDGKFNGFYGTIVWSQQDDAFNFPDELVSSRAKKQRFENHLYHANGEQHRIATLRSERFVADPL